MTFYYPLRLGVRRRILLGEEEGSFWRGLRYEAWREGVGRTGIEYEEFPEARVLQELVGSGPSNRFWLLLGEPGAGKTTLLETWFQRLVEGVSARMLGTVVPVLVRLRAVPPGIWNVGDENKIADALWDFAIAEKALLESDNYELYKPARGRAFQPLWLLDGLDEISPDLISDRLYQQFASLPGRKLVSARTAVYESMRRIADRYKAREHEILGLRAVDQKRFLQEALGDENTAERLFEGVQQNIQLRLLASNPLILSLMAELGGGRGKKRLDLPVSRAEFYRLSVEEMWYRKLRTDRAAVELRRERDEYLTQAADAMGLVNIRAEFLTANVHLRRGLRDSGLIRVDEVTNSFEFVHLTFQEYYLARSLSKGGLRTALEKHWSDVRYEETLGLLISILYQENRLVEVEEALRWLVALGEKTQREGPHTLWELESSPLRTASHLLCRSGVPLQTKESTEPFSFLQESLVKRSSVRRLAVSADALAPPDTLRALAHDPDDDIRAALANNANTPRQVLVELLHDKDGYVRRSAVRNQGIPPDLLAELVGDQYNDFHRAVAENANTPIPVLRQLSLDEDDDVRKSIATNLNAPLDVLSTLARDHNDAIRGEVGANASTSLDLLSALARDHADQVRLKVAGNSNTPHEILNALARDQNDAVRAAVGGNTKTHRDLLAALACDRKDTVRAAAAGNVNIQVDLLTALVRDKSDVVRRGAAQNPKTSPDLLARLAHDIDWLVRELVARNANTAPSSLAKLAYDKVSGVRTNVASNANTPHDALADLVRDPRFSVRAAVASGTNTPTILLRQLFRDRSSLVLEYVAGNTSTPLDLLALLAHDQSKSVQRDAARNSSTLLEDL